MVTIYCNEIDSQPVFVPSGALLQKDGKTYVFVYDPSVGKVHRREVAVLRLLSDGRAMVVSDALQAVKPWSLPVCIILRMEKMSGLWSPVLKRM